MKGTYARNCASCIPFREIPSPNKSRSTNKLPSSHALTTSDIPNFFWKLRERSVEGPNLHGLPQLLLIRRTR